MKSIKTMAILKFITEVKAPDTGKVTNIEDDKKAIVYIRNISSSKYYNYLNNDTRIDTVIKVRSSFLKNYTKEENLYKLRYIVLENISYLVLRTTRIEGNYTIVDLQEVV